jgi:hypothetical protein
MTAGAFSEEEILVQRSPLPFPDIPSVTRARLDLDHPRARDEVAATLTQAEGVPSTFQISGIIRALNTPTRKSLSATYNPLLFLLLAEQQLAAGKSV